MTDDVISDVPAIEINEKQEKDVMPKSTCIVKSSKYTFCQKLSSRLFPAHVSFLKVSRDIWWSSFPQEQSAPISTMTVHPHLDYPQL